MNSILVCDSRIRPSLTVDYTLPLLYVAESSCQDTAQCSPVLAGLALELLIGEVVQSRRRPLLGPSPGWKGLLVLLHLRQYYGYCENFTEDSFEALLATLTKLLPRPRCCTNLNQTLAESFVPVLMSHEIWCGAVQRRRWEDNHCF